jgi:glycosyltransferase 2 family protein
MMKESTPLSDDSKIGDLTKEQQAVLHSMRLSRMILPITIGLCVVAYMLYRQYDPIAFQKIHWSVRTFQWIGISFTLLVMRHLAFATRMHILSHGHFSFKKCIELIFIFEFSLCVTPTTLGGSAVSLFVMTQEQLSAARTTTIVLYKIVLDSFFFISTLPLLFWACGSKMIRPDMIDVFDIDWRARIFYFSYVGMAIYGTFFFYGLFINPTLMRRLLKGVTSLPLLKRFNEKAIHLGDNLVLAADEMRNIGWKRHLAAFLATWAAWACKFLLISALIVGIHQPPIDFQHGLLLYARLQAMFIIMAFSPSPGGAGFAEFVFGDFLSDFVNVPSVALIIALIWRVMSYYLYLAAGAIIVPNWIRKVFLAQPKT